MDQELHLTEQEIVRRNKMEDLRAKGIDPFGQKFERTATSGSLKKEFLDKTKEELLENPVTAKVAGRIMTKTVEDKI